MQQRNIVDNGVVHDELKSFFYRIHERQSKLFELSKNLDDGLQKSFRINSAIFEKELKNKQREMRKTKIDNEKRVNKIKKEYDLSENQNLQKLIHKQQEYITSFEQLQQEQQQFLKFLDQQTKNNSYTNVINSVLSDTLNLTGQRLDNSSVLDYLTGQNRSKITNFHNSIEIAISQLQNIEENLIQSKTNNQIDGKQQLISSSLSNFLIILKKQKSCFIDVMIEMEQIQKDLREQEKIRKNNIILIQTIIKDYQDQKENEIQEFVKQNDALQKQLFSITEINRKFLIYQQQLQEDLQKLSTLSEIQLAQTQIENSYNSNELKKKPTLLASRTRIYSEKKQELADLLNHSHTSEFFLQQSLKEIREKNKKVQTPNDYTHLYYSPLYSESSIQSTSFFKQTNNSQGSSQRNTKYIEKKQYPVVSTFKTLVQPEKKTAIPLKCTCPPQCLCSAQIYLQYHCCSKQLYINSHGCIICHACSFSQTVQEFNFYCPLRRVKNKFRTYQDFQSSFWQHISTLNINQEISEFWDSLQVYTQQQWNPNKQSEIQDLIVLNKSIYFYSFCPYDSKCHHKTSQEQIHFCKSPLLILLSGEIICRKCNYIGNPQYHFLQCPESKVFNIYQKVDNFISCLDLQHSNFDSEEQNAEFLLELKKNSLRKWI